MRLSFDKSQRCVEIYHLNKLHFKPHRFRKLKNLVNSENIVISVNGLRSLIQKFHKSNSVKDQVIVEATVVVRLMFFNLNSISV